MIVGGIVGYDFPHQAIALQIVTQIFLRLIKTIIAPLIFSTLVVGIAGHSDMKQVGSMGLKALIFLEVITTLALMIGFVAINISKAGVGLMPMQAAPVAPIAVQHQTRERHHPAHFSGEHLELGVDALLDMGRTAVNVISNCLASVVVAKWEGFFVKLP